MLAGSGCPGCWVGGLEVGEESQLGGKARAPADRPSHSQESRQEPQRQGMGVEAG